MNDLLMNDLLTNESLANESWESQSPFWYVACQCHEYAAPVSIARGGVRTIETGSRVYCSAVHATAIRCHCAF